MARSTTTAIYIENHRRIAKNLYRLARLWGWRAQGQVDSTRQRAIFFRVFTIKIVAISGQYEKTCGLFDQISQQAWAPVTFDRRHPRMQAARSLRFLSVRPGPFDGPRTGLLKRRNFCLCNAGFDRPSPNGGSMHQGVGLMGRPSPDSFETLRTGLLKGVPGQKPTTSVHFL